ncbi:sulfotransferase family protein [Streptomyces sp. NPDC048172]|uniref:sulfotransferase family protein n=1 Tax=Streptomyces sp. NPDC048172 TaxID=3365505 RepID=UPI0037157886
MDGTEKPPGVMPLTFVVGTGRSGSTALSRVLRLHPDLLSLNELLASTMLADTLGEQPVSGAEFWQWLTRPTPFFDRMIRSGTPLPEFLYNRLTGVRYSAETTGIPALCLMVLPHLTDDPDGLLDALEPEVTRWPVRPGPRHWEALFTTLGAGDRAAVERSGYSLNRIPELRRAFPYARFVHLYRDGPDCAVSMSRHPGYRLITQLRELAEVCGVDDLTQLTEERLAKAPPHLTGLLADRFDPALVRDRELSVTRFGALWSELIAEGVGHLDAVPADARTTLVYEELLAEPRRELARLAAFLGVEAPGEWLEAGAGTLDSSRVGTALRLPPAELAELRAVCAPGEQALRRATGD